jgi:hypothetical protein
LCALHVCHRAQNAHGLCLVMHNVFHPVF